MTGATGQTGETGNGIASIIKTATVGLVDTYTITYTNGNTTTFTVTNGEDGEVTETELNVLRQQIEDLENNQITETPTKATSYHITDSAKAKFRRFLPEGHSEQETRSYKGLFRIPEALSQTKNGLTFKVNNDGSVTVTGTSTDTTTIDLELESPVVLNGTYTFSIKRTGTGGASDQQWILYKGTLENKQSLGLNPGLNGNVTNTVEATATILRVFTANAKTINCTIYPILEEGSTVTDWDVAETHTTPNPDYEQPIKSSGDNVNLFDKDNASYTNNLSYNSNFTHFLYDLTQLRVYYISCKANTTYSISKKLGSYLRCGSCASIPSNEVAISTTVSSSNNKATITTKANDKYFYFSPIRSSELETLTYDEVINTVKIEEGTQATPYSPYGMGNITKKIVNKNFLEITENSPKVRCTYVSGANTNEYKVLCTAPDMYINEVQSTGTSYNKARNGNLMPCKYGETIYFDTGNSLFNKNYFNEFDENLISVGNYNRQMSNGTYTPTNSNCKYVTFRFGYGVNAQAGTTYTLAPIVSNTPINSYFPHEEQTYSIYTQQPFRSIGDVRDCFVKKSDGLYERHYIGEIILNGTESWNNNVATSLFQLGNVTLTIAKSLALSNYYIYNEAQSNINNLLSHGNFALQVLNNSCYLYLKNTNFTDTENFKADLAQKYASGNPVYIDYILATPLDLPCTEEQIQILENRPSTYKIETNVLSEDEIESYIDAEYVIDLKTYIDNN